MGATIIPERGMVPLLNVTVLGECRARAVGNRVMPCRGIRTEPAAWSRAGQTLTGRRPWWTDVGFVPCLQLLWVRLVHVPRGRCTQIMFRSMIGGSARDNLPGPLAGGCSVAVVAEELRAMGRGIGRPARGR